MRSIVSIDRLSKTYTSGHKALDEVSLDIHEGEILALLGPNGAGKTTLISAICGIVSPTSGRVSVAGYDNITQFRQAREMIGLVPQELTLGAFDTVWNTISFSRGLFGKKRDADSISASPVVLGGGGTVGAYGAGHSFRLPGTMTLVAVFFLAFVLYYYVNWKYLAEVWPLS